MIWRFRCLCRILQGLKKANLCDLRRDSRLQTDADFLIEYFEDLFRGAPTKQIAMHLETSDSFATSGGRTQIERRTLDRVVFSRTSLDLDDMLNLKALRQITSKMQGIIANVPDS